MKKTSLMKDLSLLKLQTSMGDILFKAENVATDLTHPKTEKLSRKRTRREKEAQSEHLVLFRKYHLTATF